ncbi:hypothetical protein DSC47_11280 [Elizabethkingia miricola]|uniref:DUF6896 domain-containing protein n=1 Tax=Elizabethkingia bruuniana TaxID=1756149 RepID=UPI00099AE271|nr:hypothetical protein [Elizabethkingia bruuniana]OPC58137.1 hypothetical protein BAY07_03330 [Elizabethkingia bruuniana]OPC62456.1 hypothetical protein BAY13_06450 [Elizabethkingia bruuniana]RBI91855.1 hypothetical protein DSC47_11280 [Elizabethkingia miricola]
MTVDYLNNIGTKDLLKEYIIFIANFENALKAKYKIPNEVSIWSYITDRKIKKGIVAVYNYTYHGSGFTVENNGIICEYDKAPINKHDIKFSLWKFKKFIETNHKQLIIEDHILRKDLTDMIDLRFLEYLIIDGINWNIYQTSFTVLENF